MNKQKEKIMQDFKKLFDDMPTSAYWYEMVEKFLSQSLDSIREETIGEVVDSILEISGDYWINRNVGSKIPIIVNKEQFKMFVINNLKTKGGSNGDCNRR